MARRTAPSVFFATALLMLLASVRPTLAIEPGEYDSRIREFSLWLMRTGDPSSLHPASPLGVMPVEVPEGFPIPIFLGASASYGFSQFAASPSVSDTLQSIAPEGAVIPNRFRLNRLWGGLGLSRRTTLGFHLLDYPAFQAFGGGVTLDHVITDYRPFFLCGRVTASLSGGDRWWKYRGILAEFQAGLHFTGFDLFVGLGSRLARLELEINDDPANRLQQVHPFQRESWETHAGMEIFLTRKFAIGGGVHWHPQGHGFGVKLIYKSRGTSPLIDPYLQPRVDE